LRVVNLVDFTSLNLVTNLATLIATYHKGFAVLIEPYPNDF